MRCNKYFVHEVVCFHDTKVNKNIFAFLKKNTNDLMRKKKNIRNRLY